MIAVISSTIFPPTNAQFNSEPRSWVSPDDRLAQTEATIQSLIDCGLTEIYLVDNSGREWGMEAFRPLGRAHLIRYPTYQYANKGISELQTLLGIVRELPQGASILKISGRYQIQPNVDRGLMEADIAGRMYSYGFANRHHSLSTRCYLVRNAAVFELFLRRTLREIFRYPSRIVGFRSLARQVTNVLSRTAGEMPFEDPGLSIENAAATVILGYQMKFRQIRRIGLTGRLAGAKDSFIDE